MVDAYRMISEEVDCRVVLCGGMAHDDPEGLEMYNDVIDDCRDLIDSGNVIVLTDATDSEVNALQRGAVVVTQKSKRGGFGLTVTEAMWKGKPVVASRVGGIPLQIQSGETGVLVTPGRNDEFAAAIMDLIRDRDKRAEMGYKSREKVRQDFLITRLLSAYLDLLNEVLN